jgi:hypothetical protein
VVELGLRVAVSEDQQGFHSPANQRQLADIIDFPVLPKKGKCSAAEHEREHDPRFARLRRRHSGVESAINALKVHGLDICPDHGIDGFKRYVALAVVGRNIHRLGAILPAQEAEQEQRARRRAARAQCASSTSVSEGAVRPSVAAIENCSR